MSTIMAKSLDKVNQSHIADAVFEAVHEVMHLYRGQGRQVSGQAPVLQHMEGRALGFFARHPGATLSELAARTGRDKSQLARLVGSLRERGLLAAQVDEADRRNVRLQLTEGAQALLRAHQLRMRQRARAAVGDLDPGECQTLLDLLQRVRARLDATG